MKIWLGVLLALFFITTPILAADQITTANKNSGPITGHLNDAINLSINPSSSNAPHLNQNLPLTVSFCSEYTVNEKVLIKGVYVNQPRVYCSTPERKLHMSGKRQNTGVTMIPAIDGQWRWNGDYSLQFKPKKAWPAGQNYQLKFDSSVFPAPVKLLSNSYSFTTEPLKPQFSTMTFFQDPNDVEKKGVTTDINFNYQVDVEDLKSHLQFILEEVTDDAKPANRKVITKAENLPFEVKMNDKNLQAAITTPLKSLPDKERFLKVVVKPGLIPKTGGTALAAGAPGSLEQRVTIPSRYSYAKIDSIEASIIKNDHYEPEQILAINTNVPISSQELTKNLNIYQLPKDKPAESSAYSATKNYAWTSSNEITEDKLVKLPKVKFTVPPTADDFSTLHSVKIDTTADRWLYIRINKGLAAKGDYILEKDYNQTLLAPAYQKEVKLLSDGALLSLGGEKKVSVYSLGASKLKFDIKRVMTKNISHFISQSGGNFESPEFLNGSFNEDNVSEAFEQEIKLPNNDPRKPRFSSFDFTPFLKKNPSAENGLFKNQPNGKGLFYLTINAIDKDAKGVETVVNSDKRFVLVSDLGLIVKTNRDGSHDAFVQSVNSGEPVSGANIQVLGVNGLAVLKVETDSKGHAQIPNLTGFTNEKRPVAYIVTDGDDLSFMPFERGDRSLDYSKFETDGISVSDEGLKAFLFSDRGIYRPGEQVHVGVVVKQGDWAQNLEGVPLQLEVTNPRGQVIDKPTVKMNSVGLVDYSFTTKDISPTGVYNIRLYISHDGAQGAELGSTSVRVEEFLPDTMKISSDFNKPVPKGWLKPEGLKANVNLQHLYGAPAIDHRIKASLNVSPGSFAFKEYKDYTFFDSYKAEKSFDQPIGEAQTDDQGKASFNLNLEQFGASTYRMTFYGEGFAQDSGRSVKTAKTALVSSMPYVIGMKAEGNLAYINKSEKRNVKLIALDPDLKNIAVNDITAKIMQVTYVSSLIKDERGAYTYRSIPKETLASSNRLSIQNTGLDYKLDTAKPGSYVLVLTNPKGESLGRIAYTIVGESNMLGAVRKDAAINIKLDQAEYSTDDVIQMNIVSPYTGSGLITLETDKVISFKWFKTTNTSSIQEIPVPKGFTGKGFVNVQFVRALDSKEIYTKPLAYAVEPFFVGTSAVDSKIQLNVPEKAKPGEKLVIKYKTKTPGKIIIYAVDEGILQYGHYQTPDPLGYFVNKRALQVGTSQILDLLMPEYSIMQQLAAPGGDRGLADGKNLNPFKRKTLPPVAYWSGIINSSETAQEVSYQIPEYFNGNLRVMAFAVSDKNMGVAEAKTFFKGDLIVSPNVPTFAAPGDEFTVGLSVANNIQGSGKQAKLNLNVTPSEHLEIIDGKQTTLIVPEGGEAKAQIRVKAKDKLGSASLKFVVSAGNKTAKYEETLSLRPPLPSMTTLVGGYVEKGEQSVQQDRDLYKEFAKADASVSTLPLSLIPGLKEYVEKFPYGCTEQILSKSMPSAVLYGQKDLGGNAKDVEHSVVSTMNRLRELQNHDGSFGYWWYGGGNNDFVTVYALHYMTIAKEKHLPVPDETFRQTQTYVKEMVNRSSTSLEQARIKAYGIYLLTRNGEVTANYMPNLLQYLETSQKGVWEDDLTAVYIAAAYKLMQLTPEANKMMDKFEIGEPVQWRKNPHFWYGDNAFYNSLNRYSQYLSVVSDNFPERLPKLDRNIVFRIANFIGEGDYNTLSSSYAIMAFSSYGQASAKQVPQLSISQDNKPLKLTGDQVKRADLGVAKSAIKFAGGDKFGLFYQIATDGYDHEQPTKAIEDGLEIKREYLDADNKPVKAVKIGDVINVVITMQAHDDKNLANMAVVDLLPGGFETVPESIARPAPITPQPESTNEDGDSEGVDVQPDIIQPENDDNDYDGQPWQAEITDAREDRVIAFGKVPPEQVTWHYKIKAVNTGTFTTPPAYVESMYDRSIKARGVIGTITVK